MNKRYDLINYYITTRKFKSFLEIGTDRGEAFNAINIDKKVSVDPDRSTNATHYMTSDEYFAQTADTFDIIFIDGLHEYSQVDRDIKNALKHLNKHGVIIMHDCHPNSEVCQRHCSYYPGGEWTGDCWKAYVKNRAELPYEIYVWDHDWGCGVIDTNKEKISDTSSLPIDMDKMTYQDFVAHPEWMNFKNTI
jgi:hypothetical protein